MGKEDKSVNSNQNKITFSVIGLVLVIILGLTFLVLTSNDVTTLPKIHYAAYSGDISKLERLLKFENINSKAYDNETPLHYAIMGNQFETVKYLIDKGADIEANSSGYPDVTHTPLFYAAREGNLEIIDLLISSGATVTNSPGALSIAIKCGYINVVEELLSLGLSVNYIDHRGNSPLLDASRSYNVSQYISGKRLANENYLKIINLFLNSGADANHINNDGNSALMYSVFSGNEDAVELFISHSSLINHKNNENKTALNYAREQGFDKIIALLEENGAVE